MSDHNPKSKLAAGGWPHESLRYRAYGLTIQSEIALPELDPCPDGARTDVTIRLAPVSWPSADPQVGVIFDPGSDTQYIAWPNAARVRISKGSEIEIDPAAGVPMSLLRLPIVGPIMALLLHVRGYLVLHASAVSFGDGSAVFLGDREAGKSTIAAGLVAAGHRMLADDVVAVDCSNPADLRVLPGFSQIKLRQAPADLGIRRATELPEAYPGYAKRQYRLSDGISRGTAAPSKIYTLARANAAGLTPLASVEGVMSLVRFSYMSRFRDDVLRGDAAARHLEQCAALARVASVIRLEVPDGLDRLSEAVRLVERDLT
jgi:hypothetical protein